MQIEVNSHYGNEHYCPITIIGVYGRDVDDDDDEDAMPTVDSDAHEEVEVPCTQPPSTTINSTEDNCTSSDS